MTPEIVSDKVFYRIEHCETEWRDGSIATVGKEENPFTMNWKNEEAKIKRPDSLTETWVNLELESVNNAVVNPAFGEKRLEELVALPHVLAKIHKAINDSILASRELAFESVRKNYFSDLPSRMQCMFLIPEDNECIQYWWKELKTQGQCKRRLFRVSLSGTFHQASAGQLIPLRTCSINSWYEHAKRYWEAQNSLTYDSEVLAYGTVTFLEELGSLDYGCVD